MSRLIKVRRAEVVNEPCLHRLSPIQHVPRRRIEKIKLTRVYHSDRVSDEVGRSLQLHQPVHQSLSPNTVFLYVQHAIVRHMGEIGTQSGEQTHQILENGLPRLIAHIARVFLTLRC